MLTVNLHHNHWVSLRSMLKILPDPLRKEAQKVIDCLGLPDKGVWTVGLE